MGSNLSRFIAHSRRTTTVRDPSPPDRVSSPQERVQSPQARARNDPRVSVSPLHSAASSVEGFPDFYAVKTSFDSQISPLYSPATSVERFPEFFSLKTVFDRDIPDHSRSNSLCNRPAPFIDSFFFGSVSSHYAASITDHSRIRSFSEGVVQSDQLDRTPFAIDLLNMSAYNRQAISFPPIRIGASRRVSLGESQALVEAHITNSRTNPHLFPNALLLASGPTAQGAADGGVVMHNLARLNAGLKGEYLAPSLEVEGYGSDAQEKDGDAMTGVEYTKDTTATSKRKGKHKAPDVDAMWENAQDLGSYQQEQSDVEGEIGAKQAGDPGMVHNPTQIRSSGPGSSQLQSSQTAPPSTQPKLDKEARKLAKKERTKATNKTVLNSKKSKSKG